MIGRCQVCGSEYERTTNGRYCSNECRQVGAKASYVRGLAKLRAKPKKKVVHAKTCKVCGIAFVTMNVRRVYCSKECYTAAVIQSRPKPPQDTVRRTCPHCDGEFEAPAHWKVEKRFCSIRCSERFRERDRDKRKRAEVSAQKYPCERACKVCATEFTVTVDNANQVYCGPRCRDRAYTKHDGEYITKNCEHCGDEFKHPSAWGRQKRFCTERCERRSERHRRRAREKDAFVETVNVGDIYRRDKWKCQLCGEPVKRKAQVPDPLAPTLDHITPLAKGGTHEAKNVQLAHFRCNSLKRDREAGQLRFIG